MVNGEYRKKFACSFILCIIHNLITNLSQFLTYKMNNSLVNLCRTFTIHYSPFTIHYSLFTPSLINGALDGFGGVEMHAKCRQCFVHETANECVGNVTVVFKFTNS